MDRFAEDRYYRPQDPALRLIATVGSLALWRHQGKGPAFHKLGRKILYHGRDLNRWLDEHRVEPVKAQAPARVACTGLRDEPRPAAA